MNAAYIGGGINLPEEGTSGPGGASDVNHVVEGLSLGRICVHLVEPSLNLRQLRTFIGGKLII